MQNPPPNTPLTTPPGEGPHDKTGMGMEANMASALGYPIGLIALILVIIEKQNRFARFHALQSLLLHVAWVVVFIVCGVFFMILTFISEYLSILGMIVFPILLLAYLGSLLFCAYKAYQGELFKLPIIGDVSAKFAAK